MTPTMDGYLRLSLSSLLETRLTHLISGLDDELPGDLLDCGRPTWVTGYTEWASPSLPRVSLGWDWQLKVRPGKFLFVRTCLPRSNIMLVDVNLLDYGWQRNQEALATVVDALHWKELTQSAIELRYR